jgi:hypothetical protein
MNQSTESKYLYNILFWAYPKSGFDVAKKSTMMRIFKDVMSTVHGEEPNFNEMFDRFESRNDGQVVYDKVVESDKEVIDPEEEVMPVIRERYPEARFIQMLPVTNL